MIYSQAFFALQISFARTVARLTGVPFHQALLDYTNFYIRFGLGRDFRPDHPTWRRYVDGLTSRVDHAESTYRFYLTQGEDSRLASSHACFSYAMHGSDYVRIHFQNAEPTGSPLDMERLPARRKELKNIFSYIRKHEPQVRWVVGTSWLYNLPAYRQCFPLSYLASAVATPPRYRHVSLWGQFVDRGGGVRQGLVREFEQRLAGIAHFEDLPLAFPLQSLAVKASVEDFYSTYGVERD